MLPSCAWFLCPLRFVIFGNFNIKMLLQAITHVLNTAEGQDEGKQLKIIVLSSKSNGQQHNTWRNMWTHRSLLKLQDL